MIKKLQALKAKKGFTLVELVVVIAIIGVLAAILVPTMLGVVQDSRITSANSTAQQIKDRTTEFLTKMDAAKASFVGGNVHVDMYVKEFVWHIGSDPGTATTEALTSATAQASDFLNGSSTDNHWGESYDNTDPDNENNSNKDTQYIAYVADSLSDLKSAVIRVYIRSGKVTGVAVVEGTTKLPGTGNDAVQFPTIQDFADGDFAGFTNKAGVIDNLIMGTSPSLALGTES